MSCRRLYASKADRAARGVAFVLALLISAVGILGVVLPAALVWLAQQFVISSALGFYVIATIRVAFGLILISTASASRAPKGLRILGGIIVMLGIVTAIAGSMAGEQSRAAIDWWERQARVIQRLTAGLILALGSFVA